MYETQVSFKYGELQTNQWTPTPFEVNPLVDFYGNPLRRLEAEEV